MIIDYNQPIKPMPINKKPVINLPSNSKLFLAPLEESIALLERQREFKLEFIERCKKTAQKALGDLFLPHLEAMALTASLLALYEGDLEQMEANKKSPLLIHPGDQQKGYYWTYTLDRDDKSGGYSCDFLLLQFNGDNIRDIVCWDETLERWVEIAPSKAHSFDPALDDLFGDGSPKAALLQAVILDDGHKYLTLEDWNLICLENHLLLELAEELPEGHCFFSKTPAGAYALLPAKANLTGLGIRQDGDNLMLLQFLPSSCYLAVMDNDPSPELSYAYDIETVSAKEALKILKATRYKTDSEGLSLLLPLSKDRLIFRKDLPSQSDPGAIIKYIRRNNLTEKEKEALDHFTELLMPNRKLAIEFLRKFLGISESDFFL